MNHDDEDGFQFISRELARWLFIVGLIAVGLFGVLRGWP